MSVNNFNSIEWDRHQDGSGATLDEPLYSSSGCFDLAGAGVFSIVAGGNPSRPYVLFFCIDNEPEGREIIDGVNERCWWKPPRRLGSFETVQDAKDFARGYFCEDN